MSDELKALAVEIGDGNPAAITIAATLAMEPDGEKLLSICRTHRLTGIDLYLTFKGEWRGEYPLMIDALRAGWSR